MVLMPTKTNTIIVHHGEIALKGRNQPIFLQCLRQNLEDKLSSQAIEWPVRQPHGYHYVEVSPDADEATLETALAAIGEVAGVVWYAPAHRIAAETVRLTTAEPDYDLIAERVVELAREYFMANTTFCVQVNRGYKEFPLTSPELERRLGTVIIDNTGWDEVELGNPDQTFYVNVQYEGIYLYQDKKQGVGGLPVGSSGRVLALLSGGIDSPVAAYLAAKRGCSVDFIHFTATRLQQKQAQDYKVSQLAKELSNFTLHSRLHLVPYTHFEVATLGKEIDYELIIFRRFMARVAERLAGQIKAQSLVTGDSLGQVASQTLENIVSNSRAITLPILRPLIFFDKQEIVRLARRINTYPISVQPYKDCCAILQQRPRTKSEHESISRREETLLPDYEALVQRTLADTICLEYAYGRRVD